MTGREPLVRCLVWGQVQALSSTEEEYIAATSAACQAIWVRRLITIFGQAPSETTNVFCDNKSTISIEKNPIMHGRIKYMEIRFHFIRDLISKGEIRLDYGSTNEQVADILTKALPIQKNEYFRSLLGLTSF